jgi:hypothetical protein
MSLVVAAAPVQPLRSVYAANAAAVAPVAQAPAQPAPAARGRDLPPVSPVAEVVLQANATVTGQNAAYDCRVTGATETVRNFDRVAMVKEGLEHMRTLFELANGGDRTPAFTMLDQRV